MPYVVPGKVAPEDLGELGDYIQKISSAGIILADQATEDHLRNLAGLPPGMGLSEDALIFDNGEEEEEVPPGEEEKPPKKEPKEKKPKEGKTKEE